MFLFKLAANGMRGRKRDTRLLITVIALAFVFIIVSVTFISSINYTEEQSLYSQFGAWQSAYFGATEDVYNKIKNDFNSEEDDVTIGVSHIIGSSAKLGTVGSYDQNLLDMSFLRLVEGRYPEAVGEIVIESDYLHGLGLSVGDVVDATIQMSDGIINPVSEQLTKLNAKNHFYENLVEIKCDLDELGWNWLVERGFCLDFTSVQVAFDDALKKYYDTYGEDADSSYFHMTSPYFYEPIWHMLVSLHGSETFMETEFESADELEQELRHCFSDEIVKLVNEVSSQELEQLKNTYLSFYRSFYENVDKEKFGFWFEQKHTDVISIDVQDIVVSSIAASYMHYLDAENLFRETEKIEAENPERVFTSAATMSGRMEFKIVGVIESYSDEWDTSSFKVANTYVSQQTAEAFFECAEKLNNEYAYTPEYQLRYNIFMTSNELTPRDMFEKMADYAVTQDINHTTDEDWVVAFEAIIEYDSPNPDEEETVKQKQITLIAPQYYDYSYITPEHTRIVDKSVYFDRILEEQKNPDSEYIIYHDDLNYGSVNWVIIPKDLEFPIEGSSAFFEILSVEDLTMFPDNVPGFSVVRQQYESPDDPSFLINGCFIFSDEIKREFVETEAVFVPKSYDIGGYLATLGLEPNYVYRADAENEDVEYAYCLTEEQQLQFLEGTLILPGDEAVVGDDYDPYTNNTLRARVNTYAFPNIEGSSKNALSNAVVLVIFLITMCAILQILFTQLRRRSRRIALLKAVGATRGQIGAMLLCEGLYLLIFGLPIGVLVGFPLIYGFICLVNATGIMSNILIYMDVQRLAIGLVAGVLALFVGILVPMIMAIRTPLRGRFQLAVPKVRKRRPGETLKSGKVVTFSLMRKRNRRLNRSRIALEMILSSLIASIMLITVMIGFNAYDKYNNDVIFNNQPDFAITVQYGMDNNMLDTVRKKLESDMGVEKVVATRFGQSVYLSDEAIRTSQNGATSPIITALFNAAVASGAYSEVFYGEYDALPAEFEGGLSSEIDVENPETGEVSKRDITTLLWEWNLEQIEGDRYYLISEVGDERYIVDYKEYVAALSAVYFANSGDVGAYASTLYTFSYNDPMWDELFSKLSVSQEIDKELFLASNNQVIVIIPLTNAVQTGRLMSRSLATEDLELVERVRELIEENGFVSTLDPYFKDCLESEQFIQLGDELALNAESTVVSGVDRYITYNTQTATVVGIIYTMEDAMWPFSGTVAPYTLIGSEPLLKAVYPYATRGISNRVSYSSFIDMRKAFYGYSRGDSEFYIYCNENADFKTTEAELRRYCKDTGYNFVNYHQIASEEYEIATNSAIIYSMLGLSAVLIALVILNSTIASAVEQDRQRYGVLQSIGVQAKHFRREQLYAALKHSVIALIVGNVVVAGIIVASNAVLNFGMQNMWGYVIAVLMRSFSLYPVWLHIALCVVFVIVEIIIYLKPLRSICRHSPVENIRS